MPNKEQTELLSSIIIKARSVNTTVFILLKFQYKHSHRTERLCSASSSGHAVPSPLVGEGEVGGQVAVVLPPT